jgi:hypothetical protein
VRLVPEQQNLRLVHKILIDKIGLGVLIQLGFQQSDSLIFRVVKGSSRAYRSPFFLSTDREVNLDEIQDWRRLCQDRLGSQK